MDFLEENILARFGCPKRIVTDNAAAFKSRKMINFCHKYHISLNHSTAYYPQGNGLAESSNKSLVRIIKKLLEDNKRSWHTKLKYALWADRISTKRAIGMSPFQLVYGAEVVFPVSLGVPVMRYFQDQQEEPNHIQRRINQIIELEERRYKAYDKVQSHQEKMKSTFDRRVKEDQFQMGDLVLKWDAPNEDKHGKFDPMWVGPYVIAGFRGQNAFLLEYTNGVLLESNPVNGRYLKHYLS